MIKELMDLARSDSNKYVLDKEKIDIDKLIEEVAKPYKEYAELENKKMELNLNYNKEINIDKNKISELMIILLDNAIKYTVPFGLLCIAFIQPLSRVTMVWAIDKPSPVPPVSLFLALSSL